MSTKPSRASGESIEPAAPTADAIPVPEAEHAAAPAASEPSRPGAPSAEAKEKFREALQRKNSAAHRSEQGARHAGAVHGPETTGTGKRMFRRKSG